MSGLRADSRFDLLPALDDDDDDWDDRTLTQRLIDQIALPALVVAFTAFCCCLASSLIYLTVMIWRAILNA